MLFWVVFEKIGRLVLCRAGWRVLEATGGGNMSFFAMGLEAETAHGDANGLKRPVGLFPET